MNNMYMDHMLSSIQRPAKDNRAQSEPYLPPGYRFHPTDEELVVYYLVNKVADCRFTVAAIGEADLNKCEPWDLPEKAKMGEKEWYFYSLKDRKYPTGLRTNRATGAGYWKATGKDREVMSGRPGRLVGMKKTLVFYRGRAPKGEKTNWIMHEYRLEGEPSLLHLSKANKDEWVVCRIFKKNIGGKKHSDSIHDLQASLPALLESPHTTACAEDSAITDSEQVREGPMHTSFNPHPVNLVSGMRLQPEEMSMLMQSRTKDMGSAAATTVGRYPELSNPLTDVYNLNCGRGSQSAVHNLRENFVGSMPLENINSANMAAAASSSAFVLRALLEQYNPSSSTHNNILARPTACKVEHLMGAGGTANGTDQAGQGSLLNPKLSIKLPHSSLLSSIHGWPDSTNNEHLINITASNDQQVQQVFNAANHPHVNNSNILSIMNPHQLKVPSDLHSDINLNATSIPHTGRAIISPNMHTAAHSHHHLSQSDQHLGNNTLWTPF